jgi:hypothetical protein
MASFVGLVVSVVAVIKGSGRLPGGCGVLAYAALAMLFLLINGSMVPRGLRLSEGPSPEAGPGEQASGPGSAWLAQHGPRAGPGH